MKENPRQDLLVGTFCAFSGDSTHRGQKRLNHELANEALCKTATESLFAAAVSDRMSASHLCTYTCRVYKLCSRVSVR